ncbi:MAG TPA: phosphoglycerate kinase, partial [Chloroflexota bacterium]|nr:phosphoglycerate kinase [Chloroflexota bacterium]
MGRLCTVRDVDWSGKTALVRVDFNVPMQDGRVADDTRIRAALPTLVFLREQGARVVLLSHLGRPDGKPNEKYSLKPVAARVSELLGREVRFATDCVGPPAEEAVSALGPGDVALLENVRFHPEEEANDSGFAGQLAGLGDIFVNDAFGTAHRAHASTEGVAAYMEAVAGLLMDKEIRFIGGALEEPRRPFVAIVGGAKVSSKLAVLENLIDRVDRLLIGGGMANTFLSAQGREVGKSLLEADLVPKARELLERGGKIVLPTDVVVTTDFTSTDPPRTIAVDAVGAKDMIVDIGPASREAFKAEIGQAGTVLWNGPMGVFEDPRFAAGTLAVAQAMAESRGTTIVGGGESVQAVEQAGLADKLSHVSTG